MRALGLAIVLLCGRADAQPGSDPNTWTYRSVTDSATSHITTWEVGSEPLGAVRAYVFETVTISQGGGGQLHERSFFTRSPTGVLFHGTQSFAETSSVQIREDRMLESPIPYLPTKLDVGMKWTASVKVKGDIKRTLVAAKANITGTIAATVSSTAEVLKTERITIAGNTFDCLVVRRQITTHTVRTERKASVATDETATIVEYYVPAVGLVKSVATTRIGRRGAPARETITTIELQKRRLSRPSWQMEAIGYLAPPAPPTPAPPPPPPPSPQAPPPETPAPKPSDPTSP